MPNLNTATERDVVLTELLSGVQKGVEEARRGANRALAVSGLPPILSKTDLVVTVNNQRLNPVSSVAPKQQTGSMFGGSATTFSRPASQEQKDTGPAPSSTPTPGA